MPPRSTPKLLLWAPMALAIACYSEPDLAPHTDASVDDGGNECIGPHNPEGKRDPDRIGCPCDEAVDDVVCTGGGGWACYGNHWGYFDDGECAFGWYPDAGSSDSFDARVNEAEKECIGPHNPEGKRDPDRIGCPCDEAVDDVVCTGDGGWKCYGNHWGYFDDGECAFGWYPDADSFDASSVEASVSTWDADLGPRDARADATSDASALSLDAAADGSMDALDADIQAPD